MSQLFEMCQTIVNYPKNEMTVDDVIDSMNGTAINPHSIRCALSKIASKSVLVEPTSRHRGRLKIYKKRDDIGVQWDWMMAHKSHTDRLIMPKTATVVKSRKQTAQKSIKKKDAPKLSGNRQSEIAVAELIIKELSKICKSLGSIENAIRENTEALRAIDIEKATVVVRKAKSKG